MIPQKQLSLADIYSDCKTFFKSDKPKFLSLLENTINLDEFIPISFYHHFYASTGRPREYELHSMLWALIIQRIFSIPTDTLLITFLKYSSELREFCGFNKVPDGSKFTRFKQDFLEDLQTVFDNLVDVTEPICQDRDISFYNKDFLNSHPEIIVDKKSDSPNEDKSLHDAKAVIPVLKDYFEKHPSIKPNIFIGDAAFDATNIYRDLLTDLKFSKAYIPLNQRSSLKHPDYTVNEAGIPYCPHDSTLLMKSEGSSRLKSGIKRYKFVCPKMKWIKDDNGKRKRRHFCEDPCTSSPCGRMLYVYPEKDLRAYPGTLRDTEEWDKVYKIRSVVEQSINHFKESFCIAGRKTQNEKTIHADLLLAGITQLITVVLADKIHKHEYIRSLKPLIA